MVIVITQGVCAVGSPGEPPHRFRARPPPCFQTTAELSVIMIKGLDLGLLPAQILAHQSGKILMGSDAIWVIVQKRNGLPCSSKARSELLGTRCSVFWTEFSFGLLGLRGAGPTLLT